MNIANRYDIEKFDEVTVNGRPGFVINPRYKAHLGAYPDGSPRFIKGGCVIVKFFGDSRHFISYPDDVVLVSD